MCYVVGYTYSGNKIAAPGAHDTTLSGNDDGFVLSIRGTDGATHWSTYYGGQATEMFVGVVVDKNLNVYALGNTVSSESIATANAFKSIMGGQIDNFIVKFDANGSRQVATYFGEVGMQSDDEARSLAIDAAGSIYALGRANADGEGGGTQATLGAYDTELDAESWDAVITKFSPSLEPIWATYYGGSRDESWVLGGITVGNGYVYVVSDTISPDAMATPGSHQSELEQPEFADGFIVKFAQ